MRRRWVVHIPLPNHLHKEWVIRALRAGKNVLCEKPLALDAEDAKEMFDAAKENNVILMEAYAYLHSPYIASLKADLKSGIIGEADYIETEFLTQGYIENGEKPFVSPDFSIRNAKLLDVILEQIGY